MSYGDLAINLKTAKTPDNSNDACPFRKSYPRVAMMQSTQDGHSHDGTRVQAQNSPQVRLAKDQHPIQALAAHSAIRRSAYPFCQGDLGEIGRSRIPMALSRDVKTGVYPNCRTHCPS
jgi:hypothetical protein